MMTGADELQALRKQARDARHQKKATEMKRCVWLIPNETMLALIRFQIENNLKSEVETARLLLDVALTQKGYPKLETSK